MKILIHGLNYAPEMVGIGKYTGEMAAFLARRGHEVCVVTAPPYYPEWKVASPFRACTYRASDEDGVRVLRGPIWLPAHRNGLNRLLHLLSFALSSFPALLYQAVVFRPDVVLAIAPALVGAPFALLVARLTRARAWLHMQDFEIDAAFGLGLLPAGPLVRLARSLERFLLRRFDRVSAVSRAMTEALKAKGVSAAAVSLFPNGVDLEAVRPLEGRRAEAGFMRAALGLGEDKIVVLYSGNLGEKQGVEIFPEIARRLSAHDNIVLLVCGEGAAAETLRREARALPNLHCLPLQPAKRFNVLLNLADIHLLPQRASAADRVMPSKLGPMLASGRPVIAMAAPGTGLAAAVEGAGRITPPEDAAAAVAAILELAANPALRADLGRSARREAEAHWDRAKILQAFESQLLALLRAKG